MIPDAAGNASVPAHHVTAITGKTSAPPGVVPDGASSSVLPQFVFFGFGARSVSRPSSHGAGAGGAKNARPTVTV